MPDANAAKKWDVASAAGLGIGFFSLYLTTACRTVFWYDSAELVTAAVTLGVAHPPGYPLYTWIAHAFTWLPVDDAVAVNAMSAAFAAMATSLVFAIGRQLGLDRGPSAIAAATLGASSLFWSNAVVAEVYCPAVAAACLVTFGLLRGLNEARGSLAIWAAFGAGLALGLHLSIATLGLGFAWLVWANGRSWKRMLAAAGAAVLGSAILLYTPLRASQDPPLNVCDPSTLAQFAWYLSGGAYRGWFGGGGASERAMLLGSRFAEQLTWVGVALAGAGVAWLARARPNACLGLVLMAAGNIAVFFTYGAHDVEVFLLPTTMVFACFLGAGVQGFSAVLVQASPKRHAAWVGVGVVALAGLVPLGLIGVNRAAADMSTFDETRPFIRAVEEALPDGAVLLNFGTPEEWQRYAVFGMYAQLVLKKRNDVRHLIAPDLRALARDLGPDARVYAYAPVPLLTHFFEVEPEGPLYRVLGPKAGTARRAPTKRKTRACTTFTRLEIRNDD